LRKRPQFQTRHLDLRSSCYIFTKSRTAHRCGRESFLLQLLRFYRDLNQNVFI